VAPHCKNEILVEVKNSIKKKKSKPLKNTTFAKRLADQNSHCIKSDLIAQQS
jgi:hypothetical protein